MPERWNPRVELTRQERAILGRLKRVRTLLPFLREHRHDLFDDAFQAEVASMYRATGAGCLLMKKRASPPVPSTAPAPLAAPARSCNPNRATVTAAEPVGPA